MKHAWRRAQVLARSFSLTAISLTAFSSAATISCTGMVGSGSGAGDGDIDRPPGLGADGLRLTATTGLRRLTSHEYDNVLRDLLADTSRPSRTILPADARTPFDNDHTVQVPSRALIDGLELLARDAVDRLMADTARRDQVIGCTPTSVNDEGCMRDFVTRFGRHALRRELSETEITTLTSRFLPLATEGESFYAAAGPTISAFLQHPEVVYRVELGKAVEGRAGLYRLNANELATRLAFFLWGTTPDEALLDAVEAGELDEPNGIRMTASRLLNDARARELIKRFHALWLRYEGMNLDNAALAAAMHQESATLIDRIVFEEQRPWQDLFRIEETFATDALAQHYGLPATGSATPTWVSYGATGRKGLLSHATFLSNGTKGGDTSPTMRGITVRELLLCDEVAPPPAGVDADAPPPETAEAKCKEERYEVHRAGNCAACHAQIDPIGFGLERFDQQGRYRTTEPGKPECALSGEGQLLELGPFSGPAQLSDQLLETGRLGACLATHLYRFAMGRQQLDATDKEFVTALSTASGGVGADFKLHDLILNFVSAEAFRHRKEGN